MKSPLCLVLVLTVAFAGGACRRAEPPAEPVIAVPGQPTEGVPTPVALTFANSELRLAADALPDPFHLMVNEGTTLVLAGGSDGEAVVVLVRSNLDPTQLEAFAADERSRMERLARGRCHAVEKGEGPVGPLIWLRGEYQPRDSTVAITCLVTVHPSGKGLLRLRYTHPPGDEAIRRQQLLDILSRLRAV